MNPEYYFYIVQCRDGTLYTGSTRNLEGRVRQHNQGRGARYTRGRRPVRLVHSERFPTQGEALRREHTVKRWSRAKKLGLIAEKILTVSIQ